MSKSKVGNSVCFKIPSIVCHDKSYPLCKSLILSKFCRISIENTLCLNLEKLLCFTFLSQQIPSSVLYPEWPKGVWPTSCPFAIACIKSKLIL